MRPNVWTKARDCEPGEDGCESGACVEVQWRDGCEGASCVEVGFASSTRCDSSTCVEVSVGAAVLVRDSKDLDVKPLTYTPPRWSTLLRRVRAEEPIDWDAEFFPLKFTEEEIDKFVGGVGNGEFDLKED